MAREIPTGLRGCSAPIVNALLVALLLCGVAGCLPDVDEGDGEQGADFITEAAGVAVSDGFRVYVASAGLGTFTGSITALSPGGEVVWRQQVPAGDLLVGGDGLLYAHVEGGVLALTPDGTRTSFDGAGLGRLAWHPWNVPMTYGDDGVRVLDAYGNELLRAWEGVTFHRMVAGAAGEIYAIVTQPGVVDGSFDYLWRLDANLQRLWFLPIAAGAGGLNALNTSLAIHPDGVVWGADRLTELRTHDGALVWGVTPVVGPMVVDPEGTTYIGGSRRVAVDAAGQILWDVADPSSLALTEGGLVAMRIEPSEFGTPAPAISTIDPTGGDVQQTVVMPPATEVLAPVVLQGRALGLTVRIEISQGVVGDGISVSQAAYTTVAVGPSVGTPQAGWTTADGPGGRFAMPTRPRQPAAADLRGLWVATRDGHGRAMQLADAAPNFGLFDAQVYGLWDYALQRRPRLVQVGTWTYDGTTLQLTAVEDLAGARGRQRLTVREAVPGTLSIEDPLQDVTRAFLRAGRLPGAAELGGALSLDWLDTSGAQRAEFGNITQIAPTDDGGAWVMSAYDGTGYLGPRQFAPSFVDTDGRGNVLSTISHAVIARIAADGTYTHYYHHEVDDGGPVGRLIPQGDELLVVGPTAVGARVREPLLWMRLVPGADDEMTVAESVPWPNLEDDTGDVLRFGQATLAGYLPAQQDTVLLAARGPVSDQGLARADLRDVVVRVDAAGNPRWELALPLGTDQMMFHDAVVSEVDDALYAFGTTFVPLTLDGQSVAAYQTGRMFLLRASLQTGRVEALVGLGSGAFSNGAGDAGQLVALPAGGVAMLFRAHDLVTPVNVGLGPVVRQTVGSRSIVAAFDSALQVQHQVLLRTAQGGQQAEETAGLFGRADLRRLLVLPDGSLVVGGEVSDSFFANDALLGGRGRQAPVLQISPCGQLLPVRYFRARFDVHALAWSQAHAALWAGGNFRSDIIEPPYLVTWLGRLGTPSEPIGNQNNLLMRLARTALLASASQQACDPPQRAQSTVRVAFAGTGAGRVVSDPPGIDCPGACEAVFDDLTTVTLQTTPAPGHQASGFQVGAGAMAGCAGRALCEVVVLQETHVTAYVDNASVRWAHALPFAARQVTLGPWRVGETVWVAGTLDAALETAAGVYDPAVSGAQVVVTVTADGVQRAIPVPSRELSVAEDGRVAAVLERGDLQRLTDDEVVNTRHHLVAFDADGALRWHQPLWNPQGQSQQRVLVNGDRVGVTWLSRGDVTLGDQSVTVDDTVFGLFDLADGAVLGLHALPLRPAGMLPHEQGGITVHTVLHADLGFDGLGAETPDGFGLPTGLLGPILLVYGRDGQFLEGARWRDQRTALRTTVSEDPNLRPAGGAMRVRSLVPEWLVQLGDHTTFVDDGVLTAQMAVPNMRTPLADATRAVAALQRLTVDGRATGAWVTDVADEVAVRGLAAAPDGATILGAATVLRDADNAPLLEGVEFFVAEIGFTEAP